LLYTIYILKILLFFENILKKKKPFSLIAKGLEMSWLPLVNSKVFSSKPLLIKRYINLFLQKEKKIYSPETYLLSILRDDCSSYGKDQKRIA